MIERNEPHDHHTAHPDTAEPSATDKPGPTGASTATEDSKWNRHSAHGFPGTPAPDPTSSPRPGTPEGLPRDGKQRPRGRSFKAGDPLTRELARRGGLASREAARRRQVEASWEHELSRQVNANPEAFVRSVLGGGNAAAKVRLLELSSELRRYRLREREEELEKREKRVDYREGRLARLEGWREAQEAEVERLQAQRVWSSIGRSPSCANRGSAEEQFKFVDDGEADALA